MQFVGIRVILKRIKAIRFMMKDKTVPWWKKGLIVFGIIYLFMPLDLIPIAILPFGILDDLVLWIAIIYGLRNTLDKYWYGENVVDFSKDFNDKNVVEGVEFNVSHEDEPGTENTNKDTNEEKE